MSKASAFHNISDTAGNSMARRIATSDGTSGSGGGWFSSSKGANSTQTDTQFNTETAEEKTMQRVEERETRSATVIECECGWFCVTAE